ncbi:MAG: pantoate--beta-alanine ligase [Planctomycetes bacterium]|nr:pantoate--beta-alanine ligase [Planctomycetota bacterium]
MREVDAYLGLGANLGDRERALRVAVQRLQATPGLEVVACSSFRESAFVGEGPAQPPYLNGVVHVRTALPAATLLALGKALEREAGRALPAPRNQPRPLDIDVLLHGGQTIDTRELVVPHPRLHEREFVLTPLRELGVDVAALARPARPRVIHDPAEFAAVCTGWHEGGCQIGVVPTMGALHEGHVSLMRLARAENDRVIATIFVNPLQFGPKEDFAAYPRDLQADLGRCGAAGVDLVFAPSVAQMYDPGFCSHVAVGPAAEGMEGALRPGHFSGVATVVARLFALCRAHRGYFGQKDAQQVAVLRRMTRDLGFPLRLVECPIVREPDGLAMSSRNVYLGAADRRAATVLFRALCAGRQAFAHGQRHRDALLEVARTVVIAERRASLDYLELRSEPDLEPLPAGPVDHGRLLIAARFVDGARPVRLLDNLSLTGPGA